MGMPAEINDRIYERWLLLKQVFVPKIIANHSRWGQHKSRATGSGIEFDKLGEYEPGDKTTHIDWKATISSITFLEKPAKDLLVKHFIEPREVPAIVVLDLSRSMFFGREDTPAYFSLELAGIFGFLANYFGDSSAYIGFGDKIDFFFGTRSGKNHILACLDEAWDILEERKNIRGPCHTDINQALGFVSGRFKSRSFVLIVSDFLGLRPGINWVLVDAISRRHDLFVVVTKSSYEDVASLRRGFRKIRDMETGCVIRVREKDFWEEICRLRELRKEIVKQFENRNCCALVLSPDEGESYLGKIAEKFLERRMK